MDEPHSVLPDLCPVWNRVARCLRCLELGRLDVRGSGQSTLLTTVVEMKMREDHCGDLWRCQPNSFECSGERNRLWVIPLVNRSIAQPNARVHQDRPVRMSDNPGMNGKRSEGIMLWVPFRHCGHGRKRQAVNGRQLRQSHGEKPTPRS